MSEMVEIRTDDERYPARLRLLRPPPRVLYAVGDLSLLDQPMVAIVGSRKPTNYGVRVAYRTAHALAGCGLVIVSGMARGLDARAHRGALDAGGGSVGVLGCGLDVTYPLCNRDLFAEMRSRGLLISEYPPGTGPRDYHFPARNRIIAGLAGCLLVVEGVAAGGTANTAQWVLGLPLGKVFAVPGRIEDPQAQGPNTLIRDGSQIYLGPDDILQFLRLPLLGSPARTQAAFAEDSSLATEMAGAEATLFDLISAEPVHVDELARRSALAPDLLLAALSSLELQGLIAQLPGKRFALAA